MSDVIISRRGSSPTSNTQLITAYITTNTNFKVPENIKNNEIFVTMIGGGYCQYSYVNCGGPSGFFNNGTLSVTPNEVIPITIGTAGTNKNNPGTTSFGTYLAANGASYDNGSAGGYLDEPELSYKLNGTYFGAGPGGRGGPWGGGGGAIWKNKSLACWGNGGIYGGGGGASIYNSDISISYAGNGGTYGGGGGAAVYHWTNTLSASVVYVNPFGTRWNHIRYIKSLSGLTGWYGTGGTYGGNGGQSYPNTNLGRIDYIGVANASNLGGDVGWYILSNDFNADNQVNNWNWQNITVSTVRNAKNGTNTILEKNITKDQFNNRLDGEGLAGNVNIIQASGKDLYSGGGGGGYGGNGGYGVYLNNILAKLNTRLLNYFDISIFNTTNTNTSNIYNINKIYNTYDILSNYGATGGGGGGYGSNGGNGMSSISHLSHKKIIGGGGGGYGGDGADGINGGGGGGYGKQAIGRYGGGGYYCPGGGINNGRGGGGIGIWTNDGKIFIGSYGCGGSNQRIYNYNNYNYYWVNAEPGVCIVQYYI